MSEQEQMRAAEREAARLAALAAEPAIAAGAADPEVGLAVLAAHLAPELAVAHRIMMQLAAIAGAVLDWPLGPPGLASPEAVAARPCAPAALAAARLAGGACWMMEQVRQGLLVLSLPPADDGHAEAFGWGAELCSEAELKRRLEAARAAALSPRVLPASAGARAVEAAARASAALLAEIAHADSLAAAIAATAGAFAHQLFAHELAAGHGLYMRLGGRFDAVLAEAAAARREPVEALRLANAAARIGARLRRGRATLALRSAGAPGPVGGPSGSPIVPTDSPNGGPNGGPTGGANGSPTGGHFAPASEFIPTAALSSLFPFPSRAGAARSRRRGPVPVWRKSLAADRRGRLANGNPAGDFLKAPRCGARTRGGGCCLQPAMRGPRGGGRCRLHGGKSTGPRTAQGRARSASARLRHGACRAEVIALQRAAAHHRRRLRHIFAACSAPSSLLSVAGGLEQRAGMTRRSACAKAERGNAPAGHGVDRQEFQFSVRPAPTAARQADRVAPRAGVA